MNSFETNFPIKSVTLGWLCQREALDTMRMTLGWGEWRLAVQCSFSLLPTHTFSLRNDYYCSFLKPELLHWVLFSLYHFHLHSVVGVEYEAQRCIAKYGSTLYRVEWAERSPLRWIPNALAVGNVFLLISLSQSLCRCCGTSQDCLEGIIFCHLGFFTRLWLNNG